MFLEKWGAALVGEYNRVMYYYQPSWLRKLANVKSFERQR